jgi:mono/diheme cytochrome c family protein
MKISKIIFWFVFFIPILLLIAIILFKNDILILYRNQSAIVVISDMDYQKKLKPQSSNPYFKDNSTIRIPPTNSLPRNIHLYKYDQTEFTQAENNLKNPLVPTEFVLRRGKNRFENFCIYCHGEKGKGDGPIINKVVLKEGEEGFPQPADLTSETTKLKSEPRLFHILSAGQNLMFPVKDRVSEVDRWAIVHYIRKLQTNK